MMLPLFASHHVYISFVLFVVQYSHETTAFYTHFHISISVLKSAAKAKDI